MDLVSGYAIFDWINGWANPYCDACFRAATDLGYHTFYYLAVAPLFWVVDRRRAGVLFLLILASGYLNTVAKLAFHTPRPDPHLARVLDMRPYQSGSNAFPSGHAQNAVVFWGYAAQWVGRGWFSLLAAVLVAVISFSRLYLAVHFPIDIIGGLVIGLTIMLGLPRILERWSRSDFALNRGLAVATVVGTLVLTFATADATLAAISGSLIGFLTGAVWLPQVPLDFGTPARATLAAGIGVALLVAASAVFETLPHAPIALYLQVVAMWVLALWIYPQLLYRLWLARQTACVELG